MCFDLDDLFFFFLIVLGFAQSKSLSFGCGLSPSYHALNELP